MELIWQHNGDSTAFEPPDPCVDVATIEWKEQDRVHSETHNVVDLHQNHLGDKVSRPLSNNGLVDTHTMLNIEDRQDILLDMDESFAY
jgi:hypothetical protein